MRPKLPHLTLRRAMLLIALVAILATASIRVLRRPHPGEVYSFSFDLVIWSDGTSTIEAAGPFEPQYHSWGPFLFVRWGGGSYSLYLTR